MNYRVTALGIFENDKGELFPREGVCVEADSPTNALATASEGYEAFLGGVFLAEEEESLPAPESPTPSVNSTPPTTDSTWADQLWNEYKASERTL